MVSMTIALNFGVCLLYSLWHFKTAVIFLLKYTQNLMQKLFTFTLDIFDHFPLYFSSIVVE